MSYPANPKKNEDKTVALLNAGGQPFKNSLCCLQLTPTYPAALDYNGSTPHFTGLDMWD